MSEPYLILHKVRGEPAFDIAEQMEVNGEIWWIIPTSGHRAYPYRKWYMSDIYDGSDYGAPRPEYVAENITEDGPIWLSLPDHYAASAARSRLATAASDILSLMGIGKAKPQEPVKRRVIPNG